MRQLPNPNTTVPDVLKALSDPIRWDIIRQLAAVEELPCAVLESTLPVSKPTISYHTKILAQAGLISVRKEGRNFFYALNGDLVHELLDELSALAPQARPVRKGRVSHDSQSRRRRTRRETEMAQDKGAEQNDLVLLTW